MSISSYFWDHRGRDRMVVGFTTTCVTSAYHHLRQAFWWYNFKEHFGRIRALCFYKIRFAPSQENEFVSTSAFIFMKKLILVICHLVWEGNCCVEGWEIKSFNAIAWGEGPRLYVLKQIAKICPKSTSNSHQPLSS